ncbi:MAG: polyribonucleotide nucleotidyltransferase, partial [Acidobacteria bacterium]|nr:polyribonucleotide nucleotidyltransferase [Acidobacteriota bacterium]
MIETVQTQIGSNDLIIETGRLARQAAGAVTVRLGDTVVLAAVTASRSDRPDVDFLPLAVDYRESFYAAGRIPGGFFKREGRPNEKEILTCRLIDRPLRPLFPSGWRRETQVTCLLLSTDRENDSDVLAITGAAAALGISDLPFDTSIGAVRVGLVDDEFVLCPTFSDLDRSALNLVVAGSDDAIVMVEAGAEDVPEARMVEALSFAHEGIRRIVGIQQELVSRLQPKKQVVVAKEPDPGLATEIADGFRDRLKDALQTPGKLEASRAVDEVKTAIASTLEDRSDEERSAASGIVKAMEEDILRCTILEEGKRLAGPAIDDIQTWRSSVGEQTRTPANAF